MSFQHKQLWVVIAVSGLGGVDYTKICRVCETEELAKLVAERLDRKLSEYERSYRMYHMAIPVPYLKFISEKQSDTTPSPTHTAMIDKMHQKGLKTSVLEFKDCDPDDFKGLETKRKHKKPVWLGERK